MEDRERDILNQNQSRDFTGLKRVRVRVRGWFRVRVRVVLKSSGRKQL